MKNLKKFYVGKHYGRRILLVTLIFGYIIIHGMLTPPLHFTYKEYVVTPNDTLWSIAKNQCDIKTDIRQKIDIIYDINHLDDNAKSILHPSQVILIPKEEN